MLVTTMNMEIILRYELIKMYGCTNLVVLIGWSTGDFVDRAPPTVTLAVPFPRRPRVGPQLVGRGRPRNLPGPPRSLQKKEPQIKVAKRRAKGLNIATRLLEEQRNRERRVSEVYPFPISVYVFSF